MYTHRVMGVSNGTLNVGQDTRPGSKPHQCGSSLRARCVKPLSPKVANLPPSGNVRICLFPVKILSPDCPPSRKKRLTQSRVRRRNVLPMVEWGCVFTCSEVGLTKQGFNKAFCQPNGKNEKLPISGQNSLTGLPSLSEVGKLETQVKESFDSLSIMGRLWRNKLRHSLKQNQREKPPPKSHPY